MYPQTTLDETKINTAGTGRGIKAAKDPLRLRHQLRL